MRNIVLLLQQFLQNRIKHDHLNTFHFPAIQQKAYMFTTTLKRFMFDAECRMVGVYHRKDVHGSAQGSVTA